MYTPTVSRFVEKRLWTHWQNCNRCGSCKENIVGEQLSKKIIQWLVLYPWFRHSSSHKFSLSYSFTLCHSARQIFPSPYWKNSLLSLTKISISHNNTRVTITFYWSTSLIFPISWFTLIPIIELTSHTPLFAPISYLPPSLLIEIRYGLSFFSGTTIRNR